jgi:hypothetical protein
LVLVLATMYLISGSLILQQLTQFSPDYHAQFAPIDQLD